MDESRATDSRNNELTNTKDEVEREREGEKREERKSHTQAYKSCEECASVERPKGRDTW